MEIELERTFLAKFLPSDLKDTLSKEMVDIYIPKDAEHPILRIRKNGQKFEMTKKYPKDGKDKSVMIENTIPLTQEEFESLKDTDGKRVHKTRYNYMYRDFPCEVDVFLDDLKGLVLVDFEFESEENKNKFVIPDFCLIEVTDMHFLAGGMLCGKKYSDIEAELNKLNYNRIE